MPKLHPKPRIRFRLKRIRSRCESFFATLECELLDRRRFRSRDEARMAIFEFIEGWFIEGWYNPRRRHSAIGYLSPVNYERSKLPAARTNP